MVLFAAVAASFWGWLCVFSLNWNVALWWKQKHPSCSNLQFKTGWNCAVSAASFCFVGWDLCGPCLEAERCSIKWTWLFSEVGVFKDILWLKNWTRFVQTFLGLQVLLILNLRKSSQIAWKGQSVSTCKAAFSFGYQIFGMSEWPQLYFACDIALGTQMRSCCCPSGVWFWSWP